MINLDILLYIIDLKILSIKEICRLTRINKKFYNLIHNETTIKYINKVIKYYNDLYKLSHINLLYRIDSYNYPNPLNELVVSSWYPLYFKSIKHKCVDHWMDKFDNILKCFTVDLYNQTDNEVNLDQYKNAYYIDLSYSYKIQNVSMLNNLHTVILNRCSSIKDVSMLSNVKYLDLSYTDVRDVSMLGKVETLILYYTNIEDVNGLGDVNYLDISYTRVKDVSSLKNVKYLKMSALNVLDITMLTNVKYLNISWCVFIRDISNLKNLEILRIDGLSKLNTSMLKNTKIIKS
jgi:hypothetical protein